MNFVGEDDYICTIEGKSYAVFEDHMNQIKGKSIDSNKIIRMYGEKPTQE
jgi:hypothetical protein